MSADGGKRMAPSVRRAWESTIDSGDELATGASDGHSVRVTRLTVLRILQLGLLIVAGICLLLAQRADSEQRPTSQLLIATGCLIMAAGIAGIVHRELARRIPRG